MKVVLDTNIFVSALIADTGSSYRLVELWKDKSYTLLTSNHQLAELKRVSRKSSVKPLIAPHQVGALVNALREKALLIRLRTIPNLSPDPDDNYILAIATEGDADYLASLDLGDVVTLQRVASTRILRPSELLEQLTR